MEVFPQSGGQRVLLRRGGFPTTLKKTMYINKKEEQTPSLQCFRRTIASFKRACRVPKGDLLTSRVATSPMRSRWRHAGGGLLDGDCATGGSGCFFFLKGKGEVGGRCKGSWHRYERSDRTLRSALLAFLRTEQEATFGAGVLKPPPPGVLNQVPLDGEKGEPCSAHVTVDMLK